MFGLCFVVCCLLFLFRLREFQPPKITENSIRRTQRKNEHTNMDTATDDQPHHEQQQHHGDHDMPHDTTMDDEDDVMEVSSPNGTRTDSSSMVHSASATSIGDTSSGSGGSSGAILETKSLVDLPIARVKRIMKSDVDVKLISPEAVLLVAKASELLLEHLAEESSRHMSNDNRKMLQYRDMVQAVKECDVFDFLEDIVPERHNLQSLIDNRAAKK